MAGKAAGIPTVPGPGEEGEGDEGAPGTQSLSLDLSLQPEEHSAATWHLQHLRALIEFPSATKARDKGWEKLEKLIRRQSPALRVMVAIKGMRVKLRDGNSHWRPSKVLPLVLGRAGQGSGVTDSTEIHKSRDLCGISALPMIPTGYRGWLWISSLRTASFGHAAFPQKSWNWGLLTKAGTGLF